MANYEQLGSTTLAESIIGAARSGIDFGSMMVNSKRNLEASTMNAKTQKLVSQNALAAKQLDYQAAIVKAQKGEKIANAALIGGGLLAVGLFAFVLMR